MVVNAVAVIEIIERSSIPQFNENFQGNRNNIIGTKNASRWSSLYIILILAACIANMSLLTSIPRKDSIIFPDYWYEGLIFVFAAISFQGSWNHITELFIFTRQECLQTKSHFTKVYIICSIFFAVPYCVSYYTWTLHLGYNHPMPFVGIICLVFGAIAAYLIAFWFLFPAELRSQELLQRQSQAYLIWRVWFMLQTIPNKIISIIATTDSLLQLTLPFVIPLARILGSLVAERVVDTFLDTHKEAARFMVRTSMHIYYTNFVTAKLFTLHQTTVYFLLIIETLLHMHGCYEIFKLTRKIQEESQPSQRNHDISNKKDKVQNLVMAEFVDAMVPLVFGIAFAMAYHGPNATLMKGIKNDYFGDQIEDVQHVYTVMVLMLSFDLLAMVISGIFLRYSCKIDLFQIFCNMIDEYWMLFMVKLPIIVMLFAVRDVNFGFDYSGKYSWITDEGRFKVICNSLHISEEEKSLLLANSTLC